jgi:tetratricopeptide (TPR) repeat protein
MMRARFALVLLLCAAPLHADSKLQQAKLHFRQGAFFFQQARYDDAIREYLAAQSLLKLPDFDFNLGQAYRVKGDKKPALAAYERYLMAEPDGAIADEARSWVVKLTIEIKAEAEAQRQEEDQLRKQEEARRAAELAPSPTPMPEPALTTVSAPPKPIYKRWWLWTAVGVVAVGAVAVGLGVGLSSSPSPPSTTLGTTRPFQ